MTLRLIQAAAFDPVSLAAAKEQARVTHSEEDALISRYIAAAGQQCEHILQRALITTVFERVLDAFPEREIELGMPPVQQVLEVRYIRPDGTTDLVPPSAYVLDDVREPGWVLPTSAWPATAQTVNAVRVTFRAGYGDSPESIPMPIRQWILTRVCDMYANRESVSPGAMTSAPGRFLDGLLDPYRQTIV